MKKLVLFYSYTGSSKRFAEKLAQAEGAELEEVRTLKRPGTVSAYVFGSFGAMRHKKARIHQLTKDPNLYDSLILVMPIWAANPAPAFNSILDQLPAGASFDLYLVSGGGQSSREKVTAYIEQRGYQLTGYHDIVQSTIDE